MIWTSNFSEIYDTHNRLVQNGQSVFHLIAICRYIPCWFRGKHYPFLAPSETTLKNYLKYKDKEVFTREYTTEILDKLDITKILNDIPDSSILLCYENKNQFCHRHLFAQWWYEQTWDRIFEITNINDI